MTASKPRTPEGFESPTQLPTTADEQRRWQEANRSWWEANPMRYDWSREIHHPEFSRDFYEEIDRRFFSNVREYMPWKRVPFDPLIDFEALRDQDVLEIGVGSGSHAALLSRYAQSFTGIDLTDYAVKSTTRRLETFGLRGRVQRMDAERMEFPDASFDFVWSWGVIHHSANTGRILEQMHRVLRPGGRAITMVYHRNFWSYQVMGGFFHGIVRGDLLSTRSLAQTVQRYTDGAIARYYSIPEWEQLVAPHFRVEEIRIYGSKAEILPLPGGRLKTTILGLIPDTAARFLTNRLRMGKFLVSRLARTP
jgi:ubiquinone/menaquinone biosynthesis C-methylase UbiE